MSQYFSVKLIREKIQQIYLGLLHRRNSRSIKTRCHYYALIFQCLFSLIRGADYLLKVHKSEYCQICYFILQQFIMKRRCRYEEKCRNIYTCKFYHSPLRRTYQPLKCKFGSNCKFKETCRYTHSPNYEQQQQSVPNKLKYKEVTQDQNKRQQETKQKQLAEPEKKDGVSSLPTMEESAKSADITEFCEIFVAQEEYLQQKLQDFFNPRLIKNVKFDKIYNYISENSDPNDVELVFQNIEKLEDEHPEIMSNFGYLKLIKTIVKREYNFHDVVEKLHKQIEIAQKKEEKTHQLLNQFKELIEYEVLDDAALIDLPVPQCYFFVDGNNVMYTHKILRKYFLSSNPRINAEGQLRLKWLISEIPNCILFFDHKYEQQYYTEIQDRIFYNEERNSINKQKCLYALQQNENADQLILETIKEDKQSQTLLITGDRILIQHALRTSKSHLMISSGISFIKFCKEFIRRKYFGNKIKKGVIKRIFVDPCYEQEEGENSQTLNQ